MEVKSLINGKSITQYIITQEIDETFNSVKLGITFKGRFAVITFMDNKIKDVYIGSGQIFSYKNILLKLGDGKEIAAYVDFGKA